MAGLLIEENGIYGMDCSAAVWATDQINAAYHNAGVQLKDADFVIEDEQNLFIVEYKNASVPGALHPESFNPAADKKIEAVIQKFYDTLHYLYLIGKSRAAKYIYIVEAPSSDSVMRKRLRNRMQRELPFRLQEDIGGGRKLIAGVDVVSIEEWNESPDYGKYPLTPVSHDGKE